MILVDTSVWVNHLRTADGGLAGLLDAGMVLVHPFVIGELALGNLHRRETVLGTLRDMPCAPLASDEEVLHLIDRQALSGSGVGYVDAHLLASVRIYAGARLWTEDKRLARVATRLGLARSAF